MFSLSLPPSVFRERSSIAGKPRHPGHRPCCPTRQPKHCPFSRRRKQRQQSQTQRLSHRAHPRERPRSAETGETAKAETSPDVTPAILALANQGELGEALSACEQALTVDKLNPGLHYLGAIILQELNQVDTAMAALRRALYLDPNFVLAHFTLGNLSMRQGNTMAARKSFTNVLSLLSAYDSDDLLPEADGLTTGRLREIVRATLQTGESM